MKIVNHANNQVNFLLQKMTINYCNSNHYKIYNLLFQLTVNDITSLK